MDTIHLTVGGFSQPAVARNLTEIPEKGFITTFFVALPTAPLFKV